MVVARSVELNDLSGTAGEVPAVHAFWNDDAQSLGLQVSSTQRNAMEATFIAHSRGFQVSTTVINALAILKANLAHVGDDPQSLIVVEVLAFAAYADTQGPEAAELFLRCLSQGNVLCVLAEYHEPLMHLYNGRAHCMGFVNAISAMRRCAKFIQ